MKKILLRELLESSWLDLLTAGHLNNNQQAMQTDMESKVRFYLGDKTPDVPKQTVEKDKVKPNHFEQHLKVGK